MYLAPLLGCYFAAFSLDTKTPNNQVYLGRNKTSGKLVILKYHACYNKYAAETLSLQRLRGTPGVVQLLDDVYDENKGQRVLVLEYLGKSVPLSEVLPALFRNFFYQLLQVQLFIRRIHS